MPDRAGRGVSASAPARAGPQPEVWLPFVWAALGLALVAGFGLGGTLFAASAGGRPLGPWWLAAAQAHGHVQLFGWAGLMVLGVGLHFLPRLRGRPLAHPARARTVLALLGGGLVLRVLTQPWLAATAAQPPLLARLGLVASGLLELAGLSAALGLLALTARGSPPVRDRPVLVQALPFLVVALGAFWLALAANLVGVVGTAVDGTGVVGGEVDRASVLLGLYGFLVPISAGMGARLFPLHYAAAPPQVRGLRAGLACLVVGLGLRLLAGPAEAPGLVLSAAGLGLLVSGLRIFAPRRAVPGQRAAWYADAAQWHGLTAAAWLALDALLLLVAAGASLLPGLAAPPLDLEQHLAGAGFVTLLILGEGANLLPGFARRPLRGAALVWATLALGNLAALLRVGPVLLAASLPAPLGAAALATSGLLGLGAVALFAINLAGPPGPPRRTGRTGVVDP